MLKKLNYIFYDEKKIYFFLFFFLLILISFFEAISIALVFPLLSLLISKNSTNIGIIDNLFFSEPSINFKSIILFCFFIVFIFLIKNFLLALFGWYQMKYSQIISRNLQKKLLENQLNLPLHDFKSTNSSIIIRNISSEPKLLVKTFILPIFLFVKELIISLGILSLFIISFNITFIYFVIFIIILVLPFNFLLKKKVKKLANQRMIILGKTMTFLREALELIKEIKIYKKNYFFLKRYLDALDEQYFVQLKTSFINLFPKLIIEILVIIVGLVLFIYYIFILNNNIINIAPHFVLIAAILLKIIPSSINMINALHTIENAKPSINLIVKILKDTETYSQNKDFSTNFLEFKNIELKQISHQYNNKSILEKINLKISKKDLIVIKGESGNGKTTLLNIICGLLKPTEGSVLVNGKSYLLHNPILNKLGYVSSENYFIDSSIAENIAMKSSVSNEEIEKIKRILIDLNLIDLTNSLQMPIGEKAINLSDGQKQRIAIARALFAEPELLIFDEATNSIDKKNEKLILERIRKNFSNMTLIFVTHRDIIFETKYKYYVLEKKNLNEKDLL
jgi:ABC-type bacteriocin/lantibiotic exporter with double-glycine peptidase domain